ncbi:hypothetical protein [Streptomyces sp. 2131.1]|uniref:hypothetical protein n=1 Tax=Streptomyces sp. 2131.1 TaxID=1855346 RepID=UPI000B899B95|nr:hypothetical protein [Streptomyces sp. 2131.1]
MVQRQQEASGTTRAGERPAGAGPSGSAAGAGPEAGRPVAQRLPDASASAASVVRPALGARTDEPPTATAPATRPTPSGPDLPMVRPQSDAPAPAPAAPAVGPAPGPPPGELLPGAGRPGPPAGVGRAPSEPDAPVVRPALGARSEPPTATAPAARPTPPGPDLPVVQRQAEAPASPVTGRPAREERPRTGPDAERSVRPTLGGQPPTASPAGGAGTPGPVVAAETTSAGDVPPPVVQRHTAEPAGPAPTERAGHGHAQRPPAARPTLGKPLREMPAGAAPFAPPTRTTGGPALPVVQRQTPDSADPAHPAPPTGPGSHARTRGGLGAPLSALPPTAGTASDAARPGPPGAAAPPAMPLRTAPPAQPPAVQPPAVQRTPDGPVRVRPVPSRRAPRPAPVQRARALLTGRTLAVRTGAAEGFTARPSAGAATRPVVPATWQRKQPQAPQPAQAAHVVQRVAADPVAPPRPHAPLPARTGPPAGQEPPLPEAAHAPVVRPHPPGTPRPGGAAAPVQRLATRGAVETATRAAEPGGVRPTTLRTEPPARADAQAVQRAVAQAGLAGVPVTVVQRQPAPAPAPQRPGQEREADLDVEDLARRLIDPVARLLRADLRRGRERSGRPYDGRR